jgi:hypothetical protein
VDVASAGVLALFALFLVKEAGIPVPVPGDLIAIGTGVAAAGAISIPSRHASESGASA